VVSLSTGLEAIYNMLPHDTDGAMARLKIAQAISLNILDGIHRLIYELRPSLLDDLGLVSAVRWLAENSSKKHGFNIRFTKKGRTKRLPSQIETTIFRVIQEAISNIAKHAQCKNAKVNINFKPNSIGVYVKDDGKGFNVEEAINSKARKGLG
jgi:signal transduction histidine kinase